MTDQECVAAPIEVLEADGLGGGGTSPGEWATHITSLSRQTLPKLALSAPTLNSKITLGARDLAHATGGNFVGIDAMTQGHLFFWGKGTGTMQSTDRLVLQSTDSGIAAVGKGNAMLGSTEQNTYVAAHGDVTIVSGYGPTINKVAAVVDGAAVHEPQAPETPDFASVAKDYRKAAVITTGAVGLISGVLGLAGNLRELASIPAYLLMTAGTLTGLKGIVEGSSNRGLFKGFRAPKDPGGVSIHGQQFVNTSAGFGGGITNFAPSGSISNVAGITAGLFGGVAASLSGILAASVSAVASAGMTSVLGSTIVSVYKATLESRLGKAVVRAPDVIIGNDILPASMPQMPTTNIRIAGDLIKLQTLPGVAEIDMSFGGRIEASAMNWIELRVGLFSVMIRQDSAKITGGPLPCEVKISPDKVTLSAGPTSSVTIDATGIKVDGLQTSVKGTVTKIEGGSILIG